MRLHVLLILAATVTSANASAAIILVPDDHPTIQAAIDTAASGDEIRVGDGTYPETIDLLGKAIVLRGVNGPEMTMIDGSGLGGSVVSAVSGEPSETVIDGFTITGGTGTMLQPAPGVQFLAGGGLYVDGGSSPTFLNCVITGNTAERGGGAYVRQSDPEFFGCVVEGNSAVSTGDVSGGGMYLAGSAARLEDCAVDNNTCKSTTTVGKAGGGGLLIIGSPAPTLANCRVASNIVTGRGASASGGGMLCSASSPVLIGCELDGNLAASEVGTDAFGGAMRNTSSAPVLIGCTLTDNTANAGGALSSNASSPVLVNCTVAGNTALHVAGALWNTSPATTNATLINCTLTGNTAGWYGGAIVTTLDGLPTVVRNSILWYDGPDEIFGPADVAFSCVGGGWPGPGNLDANPLFVDHAGGDLRLGPVSPCIDAGNSGVVPLDTVDLDGDGDTTEALPFDVDGLARFLDDPLTPDTGSGPCPVVDMGAYEFPVGDAECCHGDTDGNQVVDGADLVGVILDWGTDGGLHGGDVNGDGVVDGTDLVEVILGWGPC